MVEYGILGYLVIRALIASEIKLSRFKLMILAIILATLYGATDETHQMFVPTRSSDILDLLSDFIGAVIGVLLKR